MNQFQLHLAEIGRATSVLHMAFVEAQLDVATVQLDRVDSPLDARFEERLQAAARTFLDDRGSPPFPVPHQGQGFGLRSRTPIRRE